MCIPQGPEPTPAASTTPSMAAASALQIGGTGAPRGAAGLARSKLRLGAAPVTQRATPTPTAADTAQGASGDTRVAGTGFSVNPSLRLPLEP